MIIEIEDMKEQVVDCETNFNELFEERNSQFLKI